jgi:hypothetical protein
MDLLRHIANHRLPMAFHTTEEIDKLRILCAADLIKASIPAPSHPMEFKDGTSTAQVLAITRKGHEILLGPE